MHNRWASVELIKPRGARPRRPNRRAKGGKKIQKNTAHSIKTRRNHAHNCPTNSSPRSSTKSVRKKWGFGVWLKGESRRQGCSYTRIQIPEERDNLTQERGPHRSQEHFQILKEIATLIAALTTRGRPGWASVVLRLAMPVLQSTQHAIIHKPEATFSTEHRYTTAACQNLNFLASDFKMMPQEVNRVANFPE